MANKIALVTGAASSIGTAVSSALSAQGAAVAAVDVDAVVFLLSDRAAHITLHTITVDGGATLGV